MRILLLFSIFLCSVSTTNAQCPTTSQVTSAQKCLRISYPVPPIPLPAYLIYNGVQYDYSSGAGTSASPAEYIDPTASGACSSYSGANANITLPSGQVCNYTGGVLPISFTSFTVGTNSLNQAMIQWKINETNVLKYEIEKSTDGIHFASLGFVYSTGNGENSYQFTDVAVDKAIQYYRIKKYTNDQNIFFSHIQKLSLVNHTSFVVYPNPAKNQFVINTNEKNLLNTKLQLTDLEGKIIKNIVLTHSGQLCTIDLKNGFYYLKANNGTSLKVIVAN
jgi:hypothetical protein